MTLLLCLGCYLLAPFVWCGIIMGALAISHRFFPTYKD